MNLESLFPKHSWGRGDSSDWSQASLLGVGGCRKGNSARWEMNLRDPGAAHFPLEFWVGSRKCHVLFWDQNSAEPGFLLKKQQLLPRHELEVRDGQWHWCSQVSFTNPAGVELCAQMRDSLHSILVTCLDLCAQVLPVYVVSQPMRVWKTISPWDSSPPMNTHTHTHKHTPLPVLFIPSKNENKTKTATTKHMTLLSSLSDACNWGNWIWVPLSVDDFIYTTLNRWWVWDLGSTQSRLESQFCHLQASYLTLLSHCVLTDQMG